MLITVVIPAYNEAKRIEKAVKAVKKELSKYYTEFEIVIAEDGSTDGTDKIASKLASKYKNVKHLHSDKRLGKGRAITQAFKNSNSKILIFLDADLSTDLKHLKELIKAIKDEGYDIAIGSRLLKESKVKRPFKRSLASRIYNFLVSLLLGSNLHDHQCGFKAFKREALMKIINEAKDSHWFWDTEILILAQKRGYKIKEIPIVWSEMGETKVRAGDCLYMFLSILRLWWRLKRMK